MCRLRGSTRVAWERCIISTPMLPSLRLVSGGEGLPPGEMFSWADYTDVRDVASGDLGLTNVISHVPSDPIDKVVDWDHLIENGWWWML